MKKRIFSRRENFLIACPLFHSPSRFLFLARSANRTSWLGAASARSSGSWWADGRVAGPSGGIAPGGGRGIITGGPVAAPSGKARPPDVWWRELWAAIGTLGPVGSVAATGGCTAADIDRSTPPSRTGRQPPVAPLPLTAGRIPPPPGSGAYGRYSSSLRTSSCNRVRSNSRRRNRRLYVKLPLADGEIVDLRFLSSCHVRSVVKQLMLTAASSLMTVEDNWGIIYARCIGFVAVPV